MRNDLKSGEFLESEIEALVSDAMVGVEFDGGGASSDEHAIGEAVVADVHEIVSIFAAFLLIAASSFSAVARRGRRVILVVGLAAEVSFVAAAIDQFQVVIWAVGMFLDIEEVVHDVEAGDVSKLDVPGAIDIVIVVRARRRDWLELGDGSSAGFDGRWKSGKGGKNLKILF